MGSLISTLAYRLFEYCNEIFVAVASGFAGIVVLALKGLAEAQYIRTIFVTTVTAGCLVYVFQATDQITPSRDKVVFITGCDSGLGYSLAQHLSDIGFTVVAGCLKATSAGAKHLKEYNNNRIIVVELDVTSDVSVYTTVETVSKYLESRKYELWALVNNAAVMVFGEFEWYTHALINQQVNVNLLGSFRTTKAFSHILRKYKARLITISSHCAFATLPGLSVYGATKAALQAWNDGIRVELRKYGVHAVTFVPGSFVQSSNIMSKQNDYSREMSTAFTAEQKKFYGDYFQRFNSYLSIIPVPEGPVRIDQPEMYKKFEHALMDLNPKAKYVHEPWRYLMYHTIFRYTPTKIRDYFVLRFMQMPEFDRRLTVPEALA